MLRGMGRTRPAMVFNGISYRGLALPLGGWGLALGLGLVAVSLVGWIRLRGPALEPARWARAQNSIITLPAREGSRAVSRASWKRSRGKRWVMAGERSTSPSMRTISE